MLTVVGLAASVVLAAPPATAAVAAHRSPEAAAPEKSAPPASAAAADSAEIAAEPYAAYTPAARPSKKGNAARKILRQQIRKYPILRGARLRIGKTPGGAQAVTYYKRGLIVVNPHHKASLRKIVVHESWHIIDWRINHRIDWGERIPPYYKRSYKG